MYTRVRESGGCRERTGGVGQGWGGNVFVVGLWREWLGRAHLSGMYPSLLHNRGFDACSTSSLHRDARLARMTRAFALLASRV